MGIKKPDIAYEHPNKANSDKTPTFSKRSEQSENPLNVEHVTKASETIHVRIIAHYPIPGTSEDFDQMCEANIVPKTAMLSLLKKGVPEFEAICAKNEINKIKIRNQLQSEFIETTRALSRSTFETAKNHFDPFDVLSLRALGVKIGNAIFASLAKN